MYFLNTSIESIKLYSSNYLNKYFLPKINKKLSTNMQLTNESLPIEPIKITLLKFLNNKHSLHSSKKKKKLKGKKYIYIL